jgi:hypothetical protein
VSFTPETNRSEPDGLGWVRVRDAAILRMTGHGRFWLGMRVRSPLREHRLRFSSANGVSDSVLVRPRRSAVMVSGPFEVDGVTRLRMIQSPRGALARGTDSRQVSIALSSARLSRTPLVALPGAGFYAPEREADGTLFNWLKRRGHIDVRSVSPRITHYWLRFPALSIDVDRTLVVEGGRKRYRVAVRPGTYPRIARAGPFPLREGIGSVSVTSVTAPVRYGRDPRRLSVRIGEVQAVPVMARRKTP